MSEALPSLKEMEEAVEREVKGKNLIQHLSTAHARQIKSGVSTGSLVLNDALSGTANIGYAWGRMIEIYGPEQCLDENTFIQFETRTVNGRRVNHKGGSIKRLYERFHALEVSGKGNYLRTNSDELTYFVSSINEEMCVFMNPIKDVVYSGMKECFKVSLLSGRKITCTDNHRFFVGANEYSQLKELKKGSTVYIHNNVRNNKKWKKQNRYQELLVKYHPSNVKKVVKSECNGTRQDYVYYRVKKHVLVVEASKNNMSLAEYISVLNTEKKAFIKNLWTVPKDCEVHHKNGIVTDNSLDNLEVKKCYIHRREHAMERHNDLRYKVVKDIIVNIEPVGFKETYDIKCYSPFNNFIANGVVVHNSGKTTLALHAVAEVQKLGLACMYIDAEHACDPVYMEHVGINLEKLSFSQPDYGEQSLEIVIQAVRAGYRMIVIDSIAALTPLAELQGSMDDSTMGAQARMMGKGLRKLASIVNKQKAIVIFINQIRSKIGVMFGNPETTPGGVAMKFFASYRLEVRSPRGGAIEEKDAMKDTEEIGIQANVKIVKNKLYPPFRRASFNIIYGKGIDKLSDALDYLEKKRKFSVNGKGTAVITLGKKNYSKKQLKDIVPIDKAVKALLLEKLKECRNANTE